MHFHDSNEISLPHRARHCEVLGAYMNMVQNHLWEVKQNFRNNRDSGVNPGLNKPTTKIMALLKIGVH